MIDDYFKNRIIEGDTVAFRVYDSSKMQHGTIEKICGRKIKIKLEDVYTWQKPFVYLYPDQCVKKTN